MQRTILYLAISVFLATLPCRADERPQILPPKKLVLPAKLTAALQTRLPDYRLPTIDDYRLKTSADTVTARARGWKTDFWAPWYLPPDTSLPFICWGHFNGDSLTDVSLLLLPRDHKVDTADRARVPLAVFVVLNQTPDGYTLYYPRKDERVAIDITEIHSEPPGTITANDGSEEVECRTDYIESVRLWEGSAYAFFWDQGHYRRIWTGD
jgi:hypothetical protein